MRGTRRAAYYTNLPHGHYTFRVIARNNDGVWSGTAATAELTIEPHFYQTVWFRLLILLAIAALGYAAWRRRLMRAEREFQAVLGSGRALRGRFTIRWRRGSLRFRYI